MINASSLRETFGMAAFIGVSALAAVSITSCDRSLQAETSAHHAPQISNNPYVKPGFYAEEVEGRLWVLKSNSAALAQFKKVGEPAKSVTFIGKGPAGMTIRSDSRATVIEYLATKEGYFTKIIDGRLWILEVGSKSLQQLLSVGEPAKSVTFVGRGPLRITVRSESTETYVGYKAAKKGFWTGIKDRRLWILKDNSAALAQFKKVGEPAKSVTLVGKGPMHFSLRSDDKATILAWAATVDGFNTYIRDGRIWVFIPQSANEAEFLRNGEPAKSVTHIGVGPMSSTVRAVDNNIVARYLRACNI